MSEKTILKIEVPEQLKAQLKLLATVKGTNMTDYLAGVIEAEVQRYPEVSRLQEKLQSKEVKEGSE